LSSERWKWSRLVSVVVPLMILWCGCGVYTLNPHGRSEIKTIAVEPFQNKTSQFGLADRLTEFIIDALIADGNLKVVAPGEADAVLTGSLVTYDRVPETLDENDEVQAYKIVMDFDLSLQKGSDRSTIWDQKTRQEGIYQADSETEEDGQRRAGERLVEAVINKTTKSW